MSDTTAGFAAGIVEGGASAFAGHAASLLLDRNPEIGDSYGAGATRAWQATLTQRALELAAAVRAQSPQLFADRITWTRQAYQARNSDDTEVRASVEALAQVLRERLPAPALAPVEACLAAAGAALATPAAPLPGGLDASQPLDRVALEYLEAVLGGETRAATQLVLQAVAGGMAARDAYVGVLGGAQREIGRMWHLGNASIAEEHLVTATTRRTMAALAATAQPAPANGKRVLVATVAGNAHEVGVRMLADLFELAGWSVIYPGSDLPANELAGCARHFSVDLVLLSATLMTQIAEVERVVRQIRAISDGPPPILVGGPAFAAAPEVWRRIGADATALGLPGALREAERLTGLAAG